jgi:putative ABC transport system permease protein
MGAALIVVLFTNLAQFFLLRGARRAHELVLRRVLGASVFDLFTLLGVEALTPLTVGAVGGIAAGRFAATRLLQYVLGPDADPRIPPLGDTHLALGILCLCVCAAAVPAAAGLKIRQLRRAIELTHKPAASSRGLAEVLLGVQLLLATAIIVVTFTIAANVSAIAQIDYGMDVRNLYVLHPVAQLSSLDSTDVTTVANRVRSVPGVRAMSVINGAPFRNSTWLSVYVRGSHPDKPAAYPAEFHEVGREFFITAGMHVSWLSTDARNRWEAGDSVVVLSRGAYARIAEAEGQPPACVAIDINGLYCKRVVGIADDARFIRFSMLPNPAVYELSSIPIFDAGLLVSATGPTGAVVARLNAAAQNAISPSRPAKFESAYEVVQEQSRPWRTALPILAWLCGLAVVITGLGITAVAAAHVERLRRNLAIRSALGAPRRAIVSNAIGRACVVGAVGIGAGLGVGALVCVHESLLLFDLRPMSPAIVIPTVLTAFLAIAAGLAIPMRTVLGVSPREAMAVTS